MNTYIQLVEANQGYLDIKPGSAFPLTLSLGDIRDITKRNGSFSKTITLVGNKDNNQLLGHYYDINIKAGTFNINVIQKCIVVQNGITILDNMYMQLVAVNKVQSTNRHDASVEYSVLIKDSSSDFFTKINNKLLTDIKLDEYTHQGTLPIISGSFDNTYVDGYKYLLPYIDTSNTYLVNELKPAIYVKTYWDKIFANAGFTYTFEEASGNTIEFEKLIVPYNGDASNDIVDSDAWVVAERTAGLPELYQQLETPTLLVTYPQIYDLEKQDPDNLYDNVTGIYTLNESIAVPDTVQFTVTATFDMSVTNPSSNPISLQGTPDGRNYSAMYQVYLDNTFHKEAEGQHYNIPKDTALASGATYVLATGITETRSVAVTGFNAATFDSRMMMRQVEMNIGKDQVWRTSGGTVVDIQMNFNLISVEIVISKNKTPLDVSLNNFIPKKIKQSDFIKSITQMFNLFIDVDRNNPTNLIVTTRDKYYDDGVEVNWTKKLAKERDQTVKFLPELSNKKLTLTYKEDKDSPNTNYETSFNKTYGEVEYTFDNEYVKGEKVNKLIFSPTPNANTIFGANLPQLIGGAPKTNIRILLDNGEVACGQYVIIGDGSTSYTSYPFLSHFNDAQNPTFDINYGVCDYYSYNVDNLTNNNLYNLHWRRTLSQINNGKLLTALFDLNEVDIQKFRLSDTIRIDNSYWNVNKIIDYDVNSNNLTKVELISIDKDLQLVATQNANLFVDVQFSATTNKAVIPFVWNGGTEINGLGKIKNGDGKTRTDYTNIDGSNGGVRSGGGINNQTNSTTTGYVGGNTNIINSDGNVYIEGDNNTVNSTSVVYGDNNTIDENLYNVFVFVDGYSATTSNIFVIPETVIIDGDNPTINGIPLSGITSTTSLTYSELQALITANDLRAGSWYIITDFQTIYDQPDYDAAGVVKGTVVTKSAATEPIIVMATSGNTLGIEGYQPAYPDDKIEYDVNFTVTEYMGVAAKGRITQRVDSDNNTTFYDHRTILFLRYETINASGVYDNFRDTGFGSTEVLTFGAGAYSNYISIMADYSTFVTNNNVFGTGGYSNKLGFACLSNTFGNDTWSNIFKDECIANVAGSSFIGNVFGNYCNSNIFGNNCESNTFGDGCESNTFGEACESNVFGINCRVNIFDGYCDLNTFGGGGESNVFGISSISNVFGINCTSNILGTNCTSNVFGISCDSNTFGDGCDSNTFGDTSSQNSLGDICDSNTFGDGCNLNTINTSVSDLNVLTQISNKTFTLMYNRLTHQEDSYRNADVHTVTTTNNTTTDIYTFTPDLDGVFITEWIVTGFEAATGDAIGAKTYSVFKVIAGVVTQVSTTTLDRKSNFPAAVTVENDTDGTVIRCRVKGRNGSTIDWRESLTITK